MAGSERTNISASMSAAPSLVNSLNSYSSSTKLNGSQAAIPEPSFVENFLEKAKFYTSLCLGNFGLPTKWIFLHFFSNSWVLCSNLLIISISIIDTHTHSMHTGTSAILSVFAFLFLIPFVVDPAISTIVADYDQIPVTCMVIDHKFSNGMRNCTWSSCREGCTTAPIRWVKMKKSRPLIWKYLKIILFITKYFFFIIFNVDVTNCWWITQKFLGRNGWKILRIWKNLNGMWLPPDYLSIQKVVIFIGGKIEKFDSFLLTPFSRLFSLPKIACGYPPTVNCTEFAKKYG